MNFYSDRRAAYCPPGTREQHRIIGKNLGCFLAPSGAGSCGRAEVKRFLLHLNAPHSGTSGL